MIRAFVGIAMPEPLALPLAALQDTLPVGRPVAAETLHLTLAFLGEQPEDLLEEVHLCLEALYTPRALLQVTGFGTLGGATPAVVAAEIAASAELAALRKKVVGAVHRAGLALPRARFRPHVTLARLSHPLDAVESGRLAQWLGQSSAARLPTVPVTEIALFQSILRPDGARYEELASYPV